MSKKIVNVALLLTFFSAIFEYEIGYIASSNGRLFGQADIVGQLTIAQFALMTSAMLLVWMLGPRSQKLSDYKFILIIALLVRIVLIPSLHYTSNDVDRYLFDGYIAASGLDPYSISNNAEQLASAVKIWNPPPEHLKYVTLYPPLAIASYAFVASFGPTNAPILWSILIALASVLTLLFCVLSLKLIGKLQHTALVALSPIMILEAGVGVHIDTFATLFIAMSVYFLLKHKYAVVGVTIGLGALVKLFPLVLMGPLFLYLRKWRSKLALVIGFLACVVIGYATAFAVGWLPIGSVDVFFQKFRFGSPIFTLLEYYLSSRLLLYTVVILMLTAYTGLALYSFKAGQTQHVSNRIQSDPRLFWALQLSLSIPLLFGPVVYPWYLMSLVPVFVMAPSVWLLVWMAIIPSTYEVLSQWLCCQQWSPATWPLVLISVCVLLGVFHTLLSPTLNKFFTKYFTKSSATTVPPVKRSEVN